MKTGFWDRVLIYLYVLLTLVIVTATAIRGFGIDLINIYIESLTASAPGIFWRLILIGVCVVVGLLGVFTAVVITPSRKNKRNFITLTSDDGGQVRISLPAVRELANQAIAGINGLQGVVINIGEADDAIAVNVAMDVEGGVHVPTVTLNMQSAIRKNIERNCGINVRSVTVDVKSVLPGVNVISAEEVAVEPVPSLDEMVKVEEEKTETAAEEVSEEISEEAAENAETADEAKE